MNHSLRFSSWVVACGVVAAGGAAQAGPIFLFNGPTGDAGPAVASKADGYTVTAHGFDVNGGDGSNTPHNLYFKNDPGLETGLGLVGTSDHELTLSSDGDVPANAIQFDMRQIFQIFKGAKIRVTSTTETEAYDLYGSHTLGQLGSVIATGLGHSFNGVLVKIPEWGTFEYVGVAVHPDQDHPENNVLVGEIAAFDKVPAVPEPASALILTSGLVLGLGARLFRKARARLQHRS